MEIIDAKIHLYEEDPDDVENVKIELHYYDEKIECSAEFYFEALTLLRQTLEVQDIQILCKGANRNVYPSAMQMSMGTGRNAYAMTMGKQALLKDVVDIFDPSSLDECTTIQDQKEYFELWLDSLRRK